MTLPFRSAFPLDGGPVTPEQILAFHRATFGAAQMNGTAAAPAATPTDPAAPTTGTQTTPPAQAATPTAPTAQAPAAPAETGKVEDLPDWAQKIIRESRDEAGKACTAAKANAAAEARTALAQEIGKALGLIKDDEKPDPAKLTEQLTATQAQARQSAVELAVYKAASKHSGDPTALLDSRAFLASVADLDPNGSDFSTKVDDAIKAAVAANPKLKAALAAGASTVQHAGGPGEAAHTLDAQIEAARKAGKHELAISLQRQKAYGAP